MNGFERRTLAKKEAIINAARALFSERGVRDAGIGEIAAKAGVSQVTIYNYFSDKNALCRAVFDFFLDKAISEYEEILERDIPFPQKLKLALEREHDAEAVAARTYFSEYAWEDKALQQVFHEAATARSVQLYEKYIELGKKEGAIDENIPNDAILAYLFSLLEIIRQPNRQKSDSADKSAIFRLLLYGLLGRDI